MKTMYAIRMMEPTDILQFAGRPSICEFLLNDTKNNKDSILNRMKEDEILNVDTSPSGNLPIYNLTRALYLKFVPVDLIEERMIAEKVVKDLEDIKVSLMTISRTEKIDKFINKFDDTYSRFRDKCAGDNIVHSSCFMFIYENDKLINVYVAVPRVIINNILSLCKQKYECHDCSKIITANNSSLEEFMPEVYYEISNDNEILYYCDECSKHHKELKHIGE